MDISEELFQKFEGLTCRLSPENLSCDGECSTKETRDRFLQIKVEWEALEKEAGQMVSEEEIENESIRRTREKMGL